jgi:hypothetical protein
MEIRDVKAKVEVYVFWDIASRSLDDNDGGSRFL